MQPFKTVTSIIAYLPIANVDTDMIIPKQYLKTIKRTGLGQFAFAELRYDENGIPKPAFILNQEPFNHAQILLTLENFGCGSSREHAPWSLVDFGFKVIIAPSFADIFAGNALKNGLLLIKLHQAKIQQMSKIKTPITVDLETQRIFNSAIDLTFKIDIGQRQILLEGLDDIADTLKYETAISAFERRLT